LLLEGTERPLQKWDHVHCPSQTKHIILGVGDEPCVVLAIGAREHQSGEEWGGEAVEEVATLTQSESPRRPQMERRHTRASRTAAQRELATSG